MTYLRITRLVLVIGLILMLSVQLIGQENVNRNKFRQLYQDLPTPNIYRTASGAPGHGYWQQRADYDMKIELDDANQRLHGDEAITYYNRSPDNLDYIWVQLDQNVRAQDSDKTDTDRVRSELRFRTLKRMHSTYDGGFKIESVTDGSGRPLPHIIIATMMRVDLPRALKPKSSTILKIKWWYNVNNRDEIGGRSGYEYFEEDDNRLYTIAQYFPRVAVYNEVEGWQILPFYGSGEFALNFGDYKVAITAPVDFVVASTGVLQNPGRVLTATQRKRLKDAVQSRKPVMIVTEEEARENESSRSESKKTWIYHAKNVRDFAFAASRKFIWDAMSVPFGNRTVLAMSYYPKEGNPLWEQYSTKAVAHTITVYSKYTFDYPYPVAISVHTKRMGMEYPMISFNGGRPEPDGTYSEDTKYGMIGVIIHEVGHNYFPMIVNSDERQWMWMDEGFNTFMEYLAEQEWEHGFPSFGGPAPDIVDYMKRDKKELSPIMAMADIVPNLGNNAYSKTAAGLNILRETILGRELFDFAFKTYSQRWMFKHPSPADFFRTMEDASGVDLDWFFRGWFFTTDHVDQAIDKVDWFQINTGNPDIEKPIQRKLEEEAPKYITDFRNEALPNPTLVETDPDLEDFYNHYDPHAVTVLDREAYSSYLKNLSDEEKALLNNDFHYYLVHFSNRGGMMMPLILEFEYEDGTKTIERIPATIWRYDHKQVSKVFLSKKQIRSIVLDPHLETVDVDVSNNTWPPQMKPKRIRVRKSDFSEGENPMQRAKRIEERKKPEREE